MLSTSLYCSRTFAMVDLSHSNGRLHKQDVGRSLCERSPVLSAHRSVQQDDTIALALVMPLAIRVLTSPPQANNRKCKYKAQSTKTTSTHQCPANTQHLAFKQSRNNNSIWRCARSVCLSLQTPRTRGFRTTNAANASECPKVRLSKANDAFASTTNY